MARFCCVLRWLLYARALSVCQRDLPASACLTSLLCRTSSLPASRFIPFPVSARCCSQEGKQWQEWVWNLLVDIPKDKEEEKAKKVCCAALITCLLECVHGTNPRDNDSDPDIIHTINNNNE